MRTTAWLICALLLCCTSALSQQAPAKETTTPDKKPAAAKPGFTLAVKTKPILNLSLKAEKAKMSEVAHELSQRLKIPVFLGPERQKELISIEFSELMLEPALQLMSPTVYVDYELDTGSTNPPKALGIYFYDLNQGEPPTTAVVAGTNQAMLVEGNTEDGVEPATDEEKKKKEEEPLRVRYENGVLTVKAKKQPLPLVMLKIGEELGVPIDIQNERLDPIDANISKLPIEDVVRQLSPNIRLYYRADLTRAEKRALRIVLAEPAKAAQPAP
jgi:predicted DNA-binding antitoxin AbrB/MazE fold protein